MRYALYFTPPPSHPLTAAASRWLGRDAFSGGMQPLPHVSGVTALQGERLVGEPRRYGFHGTLVAPFRLSAAATPDQPGRLAETFCADLRPFELPKLEIVRIGRFFALCPERRDSRIDTLAASAVDHFNPLRAPLDEAEIARRKPDALTARQQAYLLRYGYPYVKEEFRFHMTLTGPVDAGEEAPVQAALQAWFEPVLAEPISIESLCIFNEPETGAPFVVLSRHAFAAATARKIA